MKRLLGVLAPDNLFIHFCAEIAVAWTDRPGFYERLKQAMYSIKFLYAKGRISFIDSVYGALHKNSLLTG